LARTARTARLSKGSTMVKAAFWEGFEKRSYDRDRDFSHDKKLEHKSVTEDAAKPIPNRLLGTLAGAGVGAGVMGGLMGLQASLTHRGFRGEAAKAMVPLGALMGAIPGGILGYQIADEKKKNREEAKDSAKLSPKQYEAFLDYRVRRKEKEEENGRADSRAIYASHYHPNYMWW